MLCFHGSRAKHHSLPLVKSLPCFCFFQLHLTRRSRAIVIPTLQMRKQDRETDNLAKGIRSSKAQFLCLCPGPKASVLYNVPHPGRALLVPSDCPPGWPGVLSHPIELHPALGEHELLRCARAICLCHLPLPPSCCCHLRAGTALSCSASALTTHPQSLTSEATMVSSNIGSGLPDLLTRRTFTPFQPLRPGVSPWACHQLRNLYSKHLFVLLLGNTTNVPKPSPA